MEYFDSANTIFTEVTHLLTSSTTVNNYYLRKISDVVSLLEPTSDFTGPKRLTEEGHVSLLGPLQMLEWPSSHYQSLKQDHN